jgi:hypothetical protein
MKRQSSVLGAFLLLVGALATQSCESTTERSSYDNRGHDDYYHDGRYAEESGYYHERSYAPDYQSDRPAIEVNF